MKKKKEMINYLRKKKKEMINYLRKKNWKIIFIKYSEPILQNYCDLWSLGLGKNKKKLCHIIFECYTIWQIIKKTITFLEKRIEHLGGFSRLFDHSFYKICSKNFMRWCFFCWAIFIPKLYPMILWRTQQIFFMEIVKHFWRNAHILFPLETHSNMPKNLRSCKSIFFDIYSK